MNFSLGPEISVLKSSPQHGKGGDHPTNIATGPITVPAKKVPAPGLETKIQMAEIIQKIKDNLQENERIAQRFYRTNSIKTYSQSIRNGGQNSVSKFLSPRSLPYTVAPRIKFGVPGIDFDSE